MAPTIPVGKMKPKVGVIFSQTDRYSGESLNLASYFCGLLSTSGYSEVYMIGFQSDGMPGEVFPRRIKYITRGQSTPKEVPVADVTFAHFHALQDCHLIIIAVNSNDTKACCTKLVEVVANPKLVPVFCLQRGVRNSAIVKEELEGKGFTVIEGVVGFAVLPDPKHGAVMASLQRPGILFERLTKEAVKVADGPLRLLERMDVDVSFRKILTPQSWGVLLYENLYVLNVLTKGTLRDTLGNREWRLVLALMVRESYKILNVAARGGKWAPDLLLISSYLTPWVLEMILALPNVLFYPCFYFLQLLPPPTLISPAQLDLVEGRKSMLDWHFAELVKASERHQYDAPVCSLVLKQIRHIETALFPDLVLPPSSDSADGGGAAGDSLSGTGEEVYLPSMARGHGGGRVGGLGGGRAGGPYSPSQSAALRKTVAGAAAGSGGVGGGGVGASIITYNNTDHMAQLMTALLDVEVASGKGHSSVSVVYGHPTLGEWWFWLSRLFAALASVVLVIFLFLHDY